MLPSKALEKEMTTHSSILAWRIEWTEKLVGLQSMGSQGVGHDWATEYACMQGLICCFVDLKNISNEDYKVFILWKL